jgi:hypothetical protein
MGRRGATETLYEKRGDPDFEASAVRSEADKAKEGMADGLRHAIA